MDLLSALPEDIFIEIVSYLNDNDIVKASLVSKGWYKKFGQSKECMQKVTVRCIYDNFKNDLDALLNSGRKYQNFIINFDFNLPLRIEINIRAILKRFSKSIIKLHTMHDFQRICKLPKLKELKFDYSCRFEKFLCNFGTSDANNVVYTGLVAKCLNVTTLDINAIRLDEKYLKSLEDALKNLQNLKSLIIPHAPFLYNLQPSDCRFRLEKFQVEFYFRLADIYDFLKHHQSSLKVVKFHMLELKDISFILTELPNLHTLQFKIFLHDENLEIPENWTIRKLICPGLCQLYLIAKLKNLQQAVFFTIYSEFIPEFLANKSLTLVKYYQLDEGVTDEQMNHMTNNGKIKFIKIPYFLSLDLNS